MTTADEPGFDLHRNRATQIRDAARDYRDESQDALGQVAANVSSRQGQFINILTLISAVFFPLTFLTGYFGMNFGVITMDLNKTWLYVLLGIVLPAAGVVATLVILRRLIARMGVPMLPSRPTAQAEPPGTPGRQHDHVMDSSVTICSAGQPSQFIKHSLMLSRLPGPRPRALATLSAHITIPRYAWTDTAVIHHQHAYRFRISALAAQPHSRDLYPVRSRAFL